MTMLRHIDFEVPDWGETPGGPRAYPDYAAAVLARQPVAYWRFDESAGPTVIDQAGGHEAAYVDTAAIDFAEPGALAYEADRAIRITGSADVAVVADSAAFRVEQFTAIAWVRPDWLSDHQLLALATTKGAFFDTAGFLIRTDVPAETIFLRVGVGTGGLVSPALSLVNEPAVTEIELGDVVPPTAALNVAGPVRCSVAAPAASTGAVFVKLDACAPAAPTSRFDATSVAAATDTAPV